MARTAFGGDAGVSGIVISIPMASAAFLKSSGVFEGIRSAGRRRSSRGLDGRDCGWLRGEWTGLKSIDGGTISLGDSGVWSSFSTDSS